MTMKIARSAGFFVLWVIIAGTEPVDLLFGMPASLLVTSASLQLLPPGTKRLVDRRARRPRATLSVSVRQRGG